MRVNDYQSHTSCPVWLLGDCRLFADYGYARSPSTTLTPDDDDGDSLRLGSVEDSLDMSFPPSVATGPVVKQGILDTLRTHGWSLEMSASSRIAAAFAVFYTSLDKVRELKGSRRPIPAPQGTSWLDGTTFPLGHFFYSLCFMIILQRSLVLFYGLQKLVCIATGSIIWFCHPRSGSASTRQPVITRVVFYLLTMQSLLACLHSPDARQVKRVVRLLPPCERHAFKNWRHTDTNILLEGFASWRLRHELAASHSENTFPELSDCVYAYQGQHFSM